jgi:hypothetical protein
MRPRRGSRLRRPLSHDVEPRVAERVDAFVDRLDRLVMNGLGQTIIPGVDRQRRDEVRDVAIDAAVAAGRRQVLGDVRKAARETALVRFGSRGFRPTWVGLNWGQSLGTVADRVAYAEIFDDAAIAAVAGDLVDEAVAADLWSGLEELEAFADRGPPEQSLELAVRRTGVPLGIAGLALVGLVGLGVGAAQATAAAVVLIGAIALAQARRRTAFRAGQQRLLGGDGQISEDDRER